MSKLDLTTLTGIPNAGLVITIAVTAIALLVTVVIIWRSKTRTRRSIRKTLRAIGHEVLEDVLIADGMGGQIHLDYLVLTAGSVLVLEIKDVYGKIFGSDQMERWTVIDGNRRFTFQNPQAVLYDRVAAVKQVIPDVSVTGRIAFTSNGEFTKGLPKFASTLAQLRSEFGMPPAEEASRRLEAFRPFWEKVKQSLMSS